MAKNFVCRIEYVSKPEVPAVGKEGEANYKPAVPAVIESVKITDGMTVGGVKVSLSKLAFLFSSADITSTTTINYAREHYHLVAGKAGQKKHDALAKLGAYIYFESVGEFSRVQTLAFCDSFLDATEEVGALVAKLTKALPTRGPKIDLAPAGTTTTPEAVDSESALDSLFKLPA